MFAVPAAGNNPNHVETARDFLRHACRCADHPGVESHSADEQWHEDEKGLTDPARAHVR
jgi:hypothetical protein